MKKYRFEVGTTKRSVTVYGTSSKDAYDKACIELDRREAKAGRGYSLLEERHQSWLLREVEPLPYRPPSGSTSVW